MSVDLSKYQDHYIADARLIILRAIDGYSNKRLNSALIERELEAFGYNITREFVHTQLVWLQEQGRALRLTENGTVLIAALTQAGADHLDRSAPIAGVALPSLPR